MVLAEQGLAIRSAEYSVSKVSRRPVSRIRPNRKLITIIGVIISLVVVNLVIQALVIQRDQEIKSWQSLIQEKQRLIFKTRMDMASLSSFERIQNLALNDMGMKVAGTGDYRCIAAAPIQAPKTYGYLAQGKDKRDIWGQLVAWFGGIGAAMAQTP